MVHVLARISVKPEAAAAAAQILQKLAEATRREAGCISYTLFHRGDAPHLFQTVEKWTDQAAADAHMTTPHVQAAIAAAGALFSAPPDIASYTQLS